MQTIHEARIVHSDLKPANFLMVEGQLKLIDFGIAKAISSDTTSIARESQVGFSAAPVRSLFLVFMWAVGSASCIFATQRPCCTCNFVVVRSTRTDSAKSFLLHVSLEHDVIASDLQAQGLAIA